MKAFCLLLLIISLSLAPIQIKAQQISAGSVHALLVCDNQMVRATGNNEYGALGDSTLTNSSVFNQTHGLMNAISASSGWHHSLVITDDDSLWTWGWNGYGQLGDSSYNDKWVPVNLRITSIGAAAGGGHSLSINTDGTVSAWGLNLFGQLGDNTTNDHTYPLPVNGLSDVVSVSAAYTSSFVVKSDGTVWAWGDNSYGQLGNNSTTDSYVPVQITGLTNMVAVANGGYGQSVALKADGTVWAWGRNNHGQLGIGSNTDTLIPVQVTSLTDVIAVECAYYHCVALKDDGTVWSWGYNGTGELGDSTNINSNVPVHVTALKSVIAIDAGGSSSIAMTDNHTIWAWGRNNYGQLGDNTTWDRNYPVEITVEECFSAPTVIAPINENETSINVYPTAAEQSIFCSFKTSSGGIYTMRIRDVFGRILFTEEVLVTGATTYERAVDISQLETGMYFLQITGTETGEQIPFLKFR